MDLVNHEPSLLSILKSVLNEIERDVVFKVEDEIFPLHKTILAKYSSVFEKMLSGAKFREYHMTNANKPIHLPSKRATIFQLLIDYFYCGYINLSKLDLADEVDLIKMAHEYDVGPLLSSLIEHVQMIISADNVLEIFAGLALLLEIEPLKKHCLAYMDLNATEILNCEDFVKLSSEAVCLIISRDTFTADESQIISAVERWLASNNRRHENYILSLIRFNLLDISDMKINEAAKIFEIVTSWGIDLTKNTTVAEANQPRILLPNENMANPINGLIFLNSTNRSNDGLFGAHAIGPGDDCIKIQLGRTCLIDSIKMTFPSFYAGGWKCESSMAMCNSSNNNTSNSDKCRSCCFDLCRCAPQYRFVIASSNDGTEWSTIVDCNDEYYGGCLAIYFNKRRLKYGTGEAKRKPEFRLEMLECPATSPRLHLAAGEESAHVIEIKACKAV